MIEKSFLVLFLTLCIINASLGANSSPSETFASEFTKKVNSSPVLKDVFNLNETTPSAFSKFLYDTAMTIFSKFNMPLQDSITIAKSFTEPITDGFQVLTLPMVVKPYANSMANFLSAEGILNGLNANSLASGYAKEMEKNANIHVKAGNPESKFKALAYGYTNFLKSFGLLIPEKFADVASEFGNQVKLASKSA